MYNYILIITILFTNNEEFPAKKVNVFYSFFVAPFIINISENVQHIIGIFFLKDFLKPLFTFIL